MSSIATSSPHRPLSDSLVIPNQALPGVGTPLTLYKYSGAIIDFGLPGDGGPAVVTFPTVPADAVALELWVNASASDDYLFVALVGGRLSNTGVLATNIAANLLACRNVASGQHMVLPLQTPGVIPSTFRFAGSKASTRIQGRFISQSSSFPHLLGSTTEFVVTGGGASVQLPFSDTNRFPVGAQDACTFQILGPGPVRMTIDGTAASATVGDVLQPGTYYLDASRHGLAISALRLFPPTGTNIVGNSLKAGA